MKIALIQHSTRYDKEENLQKAESLLCQAADSGARIACLQELFNTVYFCWESDPRHFQLAESVPGPTTERLGQIARERDMAIIAPVFERVHDGMYFNTAAVVDNEGRYAGKYRKSSIPLVTGLRLNGLEKQYFQPGNTGFTTFDTAFGLRVGILICYDRHFPEAARTLALAGAQVIFVPTATSGMSRDLWEVELRSHAIANSVYVAGVNRVGVDDGGGPNEFFGSSPVIGPEGQILAQAGATAEEVIYADLDTALIGEVRNRWGFFRDRRPDLYRSVVDS